PGDCAACGGAARYASPRGRAMIPGAPSARRSRPTARPRSRGRAVGMELLEKGAAEIIARTRVDE
ncbi:MAG: hypothetical protein ACK5AX_34770, partial [Bradyrhizobium sp.]